MSGHSKWSTIKRKKGAIDSERSKVFQKLAKELMVAAKSGDPNPENNPSLRMVVEKAKAENMPKANIESAINKAKNQGVGENYEQIRYEVYEEDKLMEDILDLNILDFIVDEDSFIIYTEPNSFIEVKDSLEEKGYNSFLVSEVTFIPNNYISLDEEMTEKVNNLIDALNDLDDVQSVYHNLEM